MPAFATFVIARDALGMIRVPVLELSFSCPISPRFVNRVTTEGKTSFRGATGRKNRFYGSALLRAVLPWNGVAAPTSKAEAIGQAAVRPDGPVLAECRPVCALSEADCRLARPRPAACGPRTRQKTRVGAHASVARAARADRRIPQARVDRQGPIWVIGQSVDDDD